MRTMSRAILIDCAWCSGSMSEPSHPAPRLQSSERMSHGICRSCLQTQLAALASAPPVYSPVPGARMRTAATRAA